MNKSIHVLPIAAVVAVVLLGAAGIATSLGWIAAPPQTRSSVLASQPAQAVAVPRCGRCGVIEAVRDISAGSRVLSAGSVTGAALGQQLVGISKDMTNLVGLLLVAMTGRPAGHESLPSTMREVTVRYEDGSSRVLTEVSPAVRQPGDRVKVVSGRILSLVDGGPGD